MINLLFGNTGLVLYQKTTLMKKIVLIYLLIMLTGCSTNHVRMICKGKKIVSCCTSMRTEKKTALSTASAASLNKIVQSPYQTPGAVILLEWTETVHVW